MECVQEIMKKKKGSKETQIITDSFFYQVVIPEKAALQFNLTYIMLRSVLNKMQLITSNFK